MKLTLKRDLPLLLAALLLSYCGRGLVSVALAAVAVAFVVERVI